MFEWVDRKSPKLWTWWVAFWFSLPLTMHSLSIKSLRSEMLRLKAANNTTSTERCPVIVKLESLNSKIKSVKSGNFFALLCFFLSLSFPFTFSTTPCREGSRTVSLLSTDATRCRCWQVQTTVRTWRRGAKVYTFIVSTGSPCHFYTGKHVLYYFNPSGSKNTPLTV